MTDDDVVVGSGGGEAGWHQWCCDLPAAVIAGPDGLVARGAARAVDACDQLCRCDDPDADSQTGDGHPHPHPSDQLSNLSQHWIPAAYCCSGLLVIIVTYTFLYSGAMYLTSTNACTTYCTAKPIRTYCSGTYIRRGPYRSKGFLSHSFSRTKRGSLN
jgi:hypothetical protein